MLLTSDIILFIAYNLILLHSCLSLASYHIVQNIIKILLQVVLLLPIFKSNPVFVLGGNIAFVNNLLKAAEATFNQKQHFCKREDTGLITVNINNTRQQTNKLKTRAFGKSQHVKKKSVKQAQLIPFPKLLLTSVFYIGIVMSLCDNINTKRENYPQILRQFFHEMGKERQEVARKPNT